MLSSLEDARDIYPMVMQDPLDGIGMTTQITTFRGPANPPSLACLARPGSTPQTVPCPLGFLLVSRRPVRGLGMPSQEHAPVCESKWTRWLLRRHRHDAARMPTRSQVVVGRRGGHECEDAVTRRWPPKPCGTWTIPWAVWQLCRTVDRSRGRQLPVHGRGSKWRQKQATELLPRSPSSTDPEAEAAFRFDWSHRLRHGGLNVGGGGRLSLVVLGGLHETRIVRSDTFVEGCAFLSRLSGEGGRQRTRGARQSPRGSRQAQILEGLRDETSW